MIKPSSLSRHQSVRSALAVAVAALTSLPITAMADASFGLAVAQSSQPYRSYDNDTIPAPIFSWEGDRFFFRGTTLGLKISEGQTSSLSLTASPLLNRYRPEDSSDWRMRQLDDRRFLATAGAEWRLVGSWGVVNAKAEAEVTGVGGVFGDLKYSYPLSAGAVTLLPEIGATYQSAELVRHYYRVSTSEALRSGFASYNPGDAVTPYFGVTALLPLGERWTATGSLRRTVLSDSITDSPMTNSGHLDAIVLGLSRRF